MMNNFPGKKQIVFLNISYSYDEGQVSFEPIFPRTNRPSVLIYQQMHYLQLVSLKGLNEL